MAEYLEDDEEGLDEGEEFQGKEKINSGGLRDLGKKEKERKEREQQSQIDLCGQEYMDKMDIELSKYATGVKYKNTSGL